MSTFLPEEILLIILEYGFERIPSLLLKSSILNDITSSNNHHVDESNQLQIPINLKKLFSNVDLLNSLELTCTHFKRTINADRAYWKELLLHLIVYYFAFGSDLDLIRMEIEKMDQINTKISIKRMFAIMNMYRKQMRIKPLKKKKKRKQVDEEIKTRKILLLGYGGVGKSTICFVYSQRTVQAADFDPTIEDTFRRNISLDGKQVVLELVDAVFGCEDFSFSKLLKKQAISRADGIMIVCSAIEKKSLEYCEEELDCILNTKNFLNVPIVFMINKVDLLYNGPTSWHRQEVTTNDAKDLLETKGFVNFSIFEASALKFVNIDEAFDNLARECDRITEIDTLALIRKIIKKGSKVLLEDFEGFEDSSSCHLM